MEARYLCRLRKRRVGLYVLSTYRANTKIYEYFQLDGSVWPLRNARSRLNLQRIPTNLSPIRGRPGRPNKRTRAPWRDFPYLFKYLRFRCPERRFVNNSVKSPPRHQQTRRFPLDDLPDGINVVVSRRAGANEGLWPSRYRFPERLPRLEVGYMLWRQGDRRAGVGVASHTSRAEVKRERAETTKLNPVTGC